MSVNPEVNKIKNIPNKVVNISMGDKKTIETYQSLQLYVFQTIKFAYLAQHVSYGLRKETYTLSK